MDRTAEILLIEDEEIDRQIVQELLALRGRGRVRVTEANCFKAGLDLVRARTFDLVLLDTRLQEISALSALRTIGEASPDTPILPHTAFITVPLRQAARRRGPFDVVVRGDLNAMWNTVSSLLGFDAALTGNAPTA